jgi:hypothetical protein
LKEIEKRQAEERDDKYDTKEGSEKLDFKSQGENPKEENEKLSVNDKNSNVTEKPTGASGENSKDAGFKSGKESVGMHYSNLISDKREFLNDIQSGMSEYDIGNKYDISYGNLDLIIQDMFGEKGPRSYSELFHHLEDVGVDGALNDIKKKEADERGEGKLVKNNLENNSSDDFSLSEDQESDKNKSSKDYEGIDQFKEDKGDDFKGIDENGDGGDKDYNRLDNDIKDRGNDFDGIDSPQEKEDKDFDDIDEVHSEGGAESGR